MRTMISFQCDTLDEARTVIDAVAAIGKTPHTCSKQYVDSKELVSVKPAEQRPNVCPGEPSITRIVMTGGPVVEILDDLKRGDQPPEKYDEHLKLLWKRGEVKFDGKEYYL